MPIIKSAIKKMRQDKARTKINQAKKEALKKVLKSAFSKPEVSSVSKAFSSLDRAAKLGLIHKNKASREKARLAKLDVKAERATKTVKKTAKKAKTKA